MNVANNSGLRNSQRVRGAFTLVELLTVVAIIMLLLAISAPSVNEFIRAAKDATFCEPVGCDACRGTGYRGRTGIWEILVMTDKVREVVHSSPELANIRNAALASGMKPMLIDGLGKAAQGITSVAEVCRVVPPQ